jgi:hypothetical protein
VILKSRAGGILLTLLHLFNEPWAIEGCKIQMWMKQVMTYLRHHVFERFHNFGALAFLVIGKDTSDDNHSSQYNAQEQLKHSSQQS